jgi:hypothetical protein
MEIIDNFIDVSLQDKILNHFTSDNFPWHFTRMNSLVNPNLTNISKMVNPIQLCHFIQDSDKYYTGEDTFNIINHLRLEIEKCLQFKSENLFRIKANLLFPFPNDEIDTFNIPHRDTSNQFDKKKSVIYYVNDSDGDTILFHDKQTTNHNKIYPDIKVSPKKGRIIIFDSNILHTSSCPKKDRFRIVINFVYNQ